MDQKIGISLYSINYSRTAMGALTEDLSTDPNLLSEKLIKIYEENFSIYTNWKKFKVRNLVNILATFFPTLPDVCPTCGINKLQVLWVNLNGDSYP